MKRIIISLTICLMFILPGCINSENDTQSIFHGDIITDARPISDFTLLTSDNMSYERTPEEKKTEEEFNEKGEKILNRISSLDKNPADTVGLDKLSTIEDDSPGDGEDEDGESSGDKKKII